MDAINFLLKEHKKVKRDLSTIKNKTQRYATKKTKFLALCQDILRHEQMEHKVWYPHFKNNKKIKREVRHLLSEEKHAEKAIRKIKKLKTDDEWEKHFLKFKKEVEHHAKEEESKLFPNVRLVLDKAELLEIGKDMSKFKKKNKNKKYI